jgi:hypothetical protein
MLGGNYGVVLIGRGVGGWVEGDWEGGMWAKDSWILEA